MPEDQPGGMVDDAATLAPKIEATNKPRGRKREEDSDADALPTKRTKTDHASSNSDVHDRSKQKNGVLPGSPVRNDDQAVASTNGQTESNFNPGTGHANEATNKSSIPPRDLVQDIFDLILPEEVSGAAVGALQPHDGPSHNSFGASPEPEAETESQQLETPLSVDEHPKTSQADQSTVVSSSHEAAAPPSTQVNNGTNNPALQALEYLEDPHTQDYLAENYGKRALQVGRGLTGKKYAKDAVNKYSPRNGWIHSDHESRDAGASESGLVIEFDMPVTRGDPSPPNPKSTRWLPAPGPEGAAVMYKKTIGIVTTNDEEYKNVKVFTTKSNKDLASFRKKGKLRHYAQIIRNPQENTVERERGVFCYLEIHCDDIDDIDLNIPGPRLMATMPLYQLPHVTPYRIVGYLKGSADIQLFCTIQKMAAAVAVEQSHESFDQRRPGWFERYRNTNATAGDNSTAAPQVSCSLLYRSIVDRLTFFRHASYRRRMAMRHSCLLAMFPKTARLARLACT
jgi:hypothetical protein